MPDLERQVHDYIQFLDGETPRTSPGSTVERGTAPRRVPPMRRLALVVGPAILILVVIGGVVLLAPFQGDDRPVIEQGTTVPTPATTAATTPAAVAPMPTITWTRAVDPGLAKPGDQQGNGISVAGDTIYMFGHEIGPDATTTGVIWRSGDGGMTWEQIADPEGVFNGSGDVDIKSLATNGDTFVAVGSEWSDSEYLGHPVAWVSSDGTTWERVAVDHEAANEGQAIAGMTTVIASNTGFVAAGDHIWTSPDGRTWTRVADLSLRADRIFELLATENMLIAVGQSFAAISDAVVLWSTDGTDWVRITEDGLVPDEKNAFLYGVAETPYGLVAVGGASHDPGTSPTGGLAASDAAAWRSTNGLTWRPLPHDAVSLGGGRGQYMSDVIAYDDLLVAVGTEMGTNWSNANGVVWESDDGGATWLRLADPDAVFGAFYAGWSGITGIVQYGDVLIATGSVTGDAAVWIGRK